MEVVVLLTNFTWLEPSRVVNQVIQVGQLKGLGIDDSPVYVLYDATGWM